MTPYELSILMHYYISPELHASHGMSLHDKIVEEYIADGVLDYGDDGIPKTTKLGEAWITQILDTPLPTLAYVDQCGNIINKHLRL